MAATVDGITIPQTDLDDDPAYDPYRVFDEEMGAGSADPYPRFAEFRAEGVVRLTNVSDLTRVEGPTRFDESLEDPQLPPSFGAYSHAAVTEVLREADRFTSTAYANSVGLLFGHSILEMDAPEHTQHRSLVAQAFRPKVLQRWESELVRPVISEQIDTFAAEGQAQLTKDFTLVYPVKVIAGMLGVPLEHWDWFRRRAVELISIASDIERGLKASEALKAYFRQIIELRRENPKDDLISELVRAEIDGHTLTDDEILPFLMLLSPAGAETTYRSTGNLLYGLFTNPDQLTALQQDPSLYKLAVEEAIRWEPPLTSIGRSATRNTEVGGVEIPGGAGIQVCVGAANRDERVWGPTAEVFDIRREPRQHLAFAFGPHMCLGTHLARLEMSLALELLLERLPDIQLDPAVDEDEVFIDGVAFRSPNQLPVVFTPA